MVNYNFAMAHAEAGFGVYVGGCKPLGGKSGIGRMKAHA